ncbi:hypothetical protein ADA01nite_29840 [Aneurinibacillus danicus]|uniref:Uncharacterized protein n=1 Tax=Aneurinibacillus danicus TaxID=267746 RepID=A0A511V9B5_9BACL|nr:hypothetical protein ADA01nite_29840 [Aneurinibacillus danicus]
MNGPGKSANFASIIILKEDNSVMYETPPWKQSVIPGELSCTAGAFTQLLSYATCSLSIT